MAKFIFLALIYAIFVVSTLSFPSIDGDSEARAIKSGHQAMVAMSEDGNPEFVVIGDDVGRAGFSQLKNILNFTAYIQNRPPNTTSINFVPLITILASLNG